jgi:hypothetical protein
MSVGAFLFLAVVVAIGSSVLCGYVAGWKNRDVGVWALLGLLFGIFAVVAVLAVSPLDPVEFAEPEEPAFNDYGDGVFGPDERDNDLMSGATTRRGGKRRRQARTATRGVVGPDERDADLFDPDYRK